MTFVELTPTGPAGIEALARSIDAAKGADPLLPVTVAVPSPYAGLALRRRLARDPSRRGSVNVRFMALARLAELLGAPALAASRRGPLTATLEAAAIRAVLAESPGSFSRVAHHGATERSLAASFHDLRAANDTTLHRLASLGGRSTEVVRLYRRFREITADYYASDDVVAAAANAVAGGSTALADVGVVVVFAPAELDAAERRLLDALARAGTCRVILTLTGDDDADLATRELADQLAASFGVPLARSGSVGMLIGTAIVDAPESDDEVREIVRGIARRLEAGTPLHRIAILYRNAEPYARLLHEHLDLAGIPWNGPAARTLADTVPGRSLLGLLALGDRDLRRDELMAWVASAPIHETEHGPVVPASRWDALARRAGIVGGPEQWATRLGHLAHRLSADLEIASQTQQASDGWRRGVTRDLEQLDRLARFVAELATALAPDTASGWPDGARWTDRLLRRYLDPTHARPPWPDGELAAYDAIRERIAALARIDVVGAPADLAAFRRALTAELDEQLASTARFGNGVFVGRVRDAAGTEFDTAFIVGMAEGAFPPRSSDDPLLPDRVRTAAGGLTLRTDRAARERREYLAALAAAPERVLTFARVDSRVRREQQPSRWLLETASELAGRRRFAHELRLDASRPWLTVLESFEAAVVGTDTPGSVQELDLGALTRWQRAGRSVGAHTLARHEPALESGFGAIAARRSPMLTSYDGLTGPIDGVAPDPTHPLSPTALETYAACPFRYLLANVLRLADLDRPEELDAIGPLARGSLVHEVLREFIETAEAPGRPDQPWTAHDRALLRAIARRQFDDAVAAGLTGRPLVWAVEERRLVRELDTALDTDEEVRATRGVLPAAVEVNFGISSEGAPAVRFELGEGIAVSFRGRIDRVDRSPSGDRLAVWDYKTGGIARYRAMRSDPLDRGTRLQLAIYALAARARWGDLPVEAGYWFTRRPGADQLVGYTLDDAVVDRLGEVMRTLLDGVAAGRFPARPGDEVNGEHEHCRTCAFDRVCPTDRDRVWLRRRTDPSLQQYVALAEPDTAPVG